MRSMFAASFLLGIAVALTGCAVDVDRTETEEAGDTSASQGALSAYGGKLVGAYETTDSASDFDVLVLRANGTYVSEERVVCITAPCPSIRQEGKYIAYRPTGKSALGALRLVPKTGTSTYYRVRLRVPNEALSLSRDFGKTFYDFVRVEPTGTCGTRGGATCATGQFCEFGSLCGRADEGGQCVTKPEVCTKEYAPVCGCDGVTYGNDCLRGMAGASKVYDGECAPADPCYIGGCSGEICSDQDAVSSLCTWQEEFACYDAKSSCERQADGRCGWTQTEALTTCLASK